MYQFLKAAITNYHKMDNLKHQKHTLSKFWRFEVKESRHVQSHTLSKGSRSFLASSSLLQLTMTHDFPWPIETFFQSVASVVTSYSPFVSTVFMPPESSIELGPTLIQYNLILTWLHLQRAYFQIISDSQVLEVRTSTYLFGDTILTTTLSFNYKNCINTIQSWSISIVTLNKNHVILFSFEVKKILFF